MKNEPGINEKKIIAFTGSGYEDRTDMLAVESSLTVTVNGSPAYFCMRTPGMDRELAVGLCFSDGRILSYGDIVEIAEQDGAVNMRVQGSGEKSGAEMKIIRSSAGIIPADRYSVTSHTEQGEQDKGLFTAERLFAFQDDFFSRQDLYEKTGATHAAGIFTREGDFLAYAEDVGRHNALDKCIGRLLIEDKLQNASVCMLSSRLSYEMVLKAVRAGFSVVAGVSAPTSFAVDLARESGITLVGFMRKGKFNIYSGYWRINID